METAVLFDNVTVTLGGVQILDGVTAAVPKGSSAAIIGPNGAGKTTLLLALLGQAPYSGRIVMNHGGRPRLGYVPQVLDFDRGMPVTVLDAMVMGRQRRPLWFGHARKRRDEAVALLARIKADHLVSRRLGALSGGELQRVLLALALQERPEVLILDEPSAGVDVSGGSLLCELLDSLQIEQGFTRIMVTHDLSMVAAHADYVICLNRKVFGQGPTMQTLTANILAATFGVHFGVAGLDVPQQIIGKHCDWPHAHAEHSHD